MTRSSDLPGAARVGSEAALPDDRDERHIRATINALNEGAGRDAAVDSDAETAALHALLGYGAISEDEPGTPTAR